MCRDLQAPPEVFFTVPKVSPRPPNERVIAKVKDYEDVVAKANNKNPAKGLTPELIAQIEQDILGIPPQTESENEEQ